MREPFAIDQPTCISFSGGRTSAYMLWRVLQANGGLPADAVVCFANTGKEVEATLRFVRDCAEHWHVPNLASKPSGARFRADGPSYADLARFAADQRDLFDGANEPIACFCGD